MNKTMTSNKRRINSDDFTNLGFDPTIDATQFILNSKLNRKDNDLYYGVMFLDNHLIVNGDFNNPTIDGTIRVKQKTPILPLYCRNLIHQRRSRRNCRIHRSR
jgi:hypothetical protein